jgi:hypothetical protein
MPTIELLSCSIVEERFERLHHDDDRGPENNHKQRGKDKKNQRKDKFDGGFGCCFFHLLNPLCSERVRVCAEGLPDAGAKLL